MEFQLEHHFPIILKSLAGVLKIHVPSSLQEEEHPDANNTKLQLCFYSCLPLLVASQGRGVNTLTKKFTHLVHVHECCNTYHPAVAAGYKSPLLTHCLGNSATVV